MPRTQAPWRIVKARSLTHLKGANGEQIASFSNDDDAALAVAAPTMLEMLKMARDALAAIRRHPKYPWKDQEGDGVPIDIILDTVIGETEGRS